MTSRDRLFLALLVAATVAWGALYVFRTSFVHEGERVFSLWDDGMISMQYARNLREGRGLVWIAGGDRVQGFSNLGPTLVMAGIHLLPVSPTRISLVFQLLNLALLAACPVLVWRIARRLNPETPWVAAGASIATALCAPLAVWSLQGADVGFVAFWLLVCVDWLARRRDTGAGFFALLGAGLLIRPDAALFYVVLVAAAARASRAPRSRILTGLGILLVVEGAWLLFGWLYYGDPLPNTYYLKATGAPRHLAIASALQQLGESVPWLVVPTALAIVAVVRDRARPEVATSAALFGAALGYTIWVGGDWVFEYGVRFLAPALPFLLLLALAGWWGLVARILPARLAPAGFLATGLPLVLMASPRAATSDWLDPRTEPMHRSFNESNFRFAQYLREFTDPATTVAVHWGGVAPYFSGRPAVDVLGKSDRYIAKIEVAEFFPGHAKWDWDYVLGVRRPDVLRGPSRGLRERYDFRDGWWRVETGQGLQFYLRKESVAKLRDPRAQLVDQLSGERIPRRRSRPRGAGGARGQTGTSKLGEAA